MLITATTLYFAHPFDFDIQSFCDLHYFCIKVDILYEMEPLLRSGVMSSHKLFTCRRLKGGPTNIQHCLLGLNTTRSTVCRHHSSSCDDESEREFLASLGGGGSVDLTIDGATGVASILINHPEIRNGFSGKMMVEFRDVVNEISKWDAGKGVIVRGAGNTFCSGGDLSMMRRVLNPEAGAQVSTFMQNTMAKLYHLPVINVALLEGDTLGGGAEIAVGCDVRLMTQSARLGFVQSRIGVVPGWGGGARLVQLVGPAKALNILGSAKLFTSEASKQLGLVEEILTDDSQAYDQALAWLKKRVHAPRQVIRAMKQVVLNGSMGIYSAELMAKERDIFTTVWGGPAHQGAMDKNIKHTK